MPDRSSTHPPRRLGSLRQLEQFVTVAETRSFTRAAARLNIAQPALSLSIQKLEQDLGSPLFVREPRGVRLTRVGETALAEARLTLGHAARFAQLAQAAAEGLVGRLRLGFVPSATLGLLQRLILGFGARYPGIELSLIEARSSGSVASALKEAEIDIGIVRTPLLDGPDVRMLDLQSDLFTAALPADHALAGATSVALADLRDERLVMYRSDGAPTLRAAVMLACQQAGFLPKISHEVAAIATVLALVEARQGIGLVPSLHGNMAGRNVVLVPLRDAAPMLATGLSLIWRDTGDATVDLFVAAARP